MSRVLSRGWLRRGCVSRPFSAADLVEALQERESESQIYVQLDADGCISRECGASVATVACNAHLAPNVHARTAVLEHAPLEHPPTPALRLRLLTDLPPHHELLLWPDEDLLALVDMPFLTLRNIRGKKDYVCHECGERFEQPNPLKVHLLLSCAQYSPTLFWRTLVGRIRDAATSSAFRNIVALPLAPAPVPAPYAADTEDARAARLEALAAEWGRSRDGHLCLYCGKLYSRKYGLKIHIRTHTGYRPLRCRYCLRAFGDPSNLNKHVRLHAAPRAATPHACVLCGRALARRRDLERHLRTHAQRDCEP